MSKTKTWLITGVSSGFGRAIASAALEAGDIVVGTVRKDLDVTDFVARAPGRAHGILLDVTDHAAIEPAVHHVEVEIGPLDVLVNNAGYGHEGLMEESSIDDMRRQFEVKVFGATAVTKAVLPFMRRRRRGLKRLPGIGVNFIDTADSYGPFVSEDLIAEALHPYDGLLIATKGGLVRPGVTEGEWPIVGDPNYLGQAVRMSLRPLKVDRIDVWQLHRIDKKVPQKEQFEAIKSFIDQSFIRYAGLSQVTVEQIEAAREVFPVATVQNLYNLGNRPDEDVLNYCEAHGIGFIPWFPLAAAASPSRAGRLAQIALAWLLKRSPVMLPTPGTSRVKHLEENVAAAGVTLSDSEFAELDTVSPHSGPPNMFFGVIPCGPLGA